MEVTANEILCTPPDEFPANNISQDNLSIYITDQEKLETNERTVVVHIGSMLQLKAGALTYKLPGNAANKTTIIAGTLGGVAILALAAVIGKCIKMIMLDQLDRMQ